MSKFIQKITRSQLFLPIVALILVLVFNVIKTPTFFKITIMNGTLYGFIIDRYYQSSERTGHSRYWYD
jgi:simple sugar transport system permease protein